MINTRKPNGRWNRCLKRKSKILRSRFELSTMLSLRCETFVRNWQETLGRSTPFFVRQDPFSTHSRERSRTTPAIFDLQSVTNADGDMDWWISIVDNMVSLCTREEGRFRKPPRPRKTQLTGSAPEDVESEPAKSKFSESESQVAPLFPLRCKTYQCLHYRRNAGLSLHKRRRNLHNKYCLQRRCVRHHVFQPGKA